MTKTLRPLTESNLGPGKRFRQEPLINGRQDFRRLAGKELGWSSQAFAHRDEFPVNVWDVGDSITECYGVTDDSKRWTDRERQAIQSRFRSGGVGFIAAKHAQAVTWPYTTNPDGKNIFALTGSEVDALDHGFGYARRNSWLNTGASRAGTIDCDRFWVVYTQGGTGNITVDVDINTPFALTATIASAATVTASGRIWDSQRDGGMTLTLGTHTVKVTAATGTTLLDGFVVFYTDATAGIHVWEGGHSGYFATSFDGHDSDGGDMLWADLAYQPFTPALFTDFVCNGTTTVTSATAAFTDLDLGEYIFFEAGKGGTNSVARILARASGTSITVDRALTAGTIKGIINRAQFTDAVLTSGSTTMTSATAAFNPWDAGMFVQGPTGIPAGTYIRRYNSATSVELSAAATANQSAQTVRVLGRQKQWCAPDVLRIELGINDASIGVTSDSYKQSIRDIAALPAERACIGFPIGSVQRYAPSVILMGMWAPVTASGSTWSGVISATSGQPAITSDTLDFDPADVGKTITSPSNTPIQAGTTILSVQSNRQATLSLNAVATTTTGSASILLHISQDKHWQRMRTALIELAAENTWRLQDLYSLGGYIGVTDPLNLTYDGAHPNNHGSQWVADEGDIVLTGQPRNAAIPQGIIDAKGDWLSGSAPDVAGKGSAGVDGQMLVFGAGALLGRLPMDAASAASIGQILPSTAGVGAAITTGMVAPTLTATVSTIDDNEAQWLNFATSIVQFNPSGIVSPTFTITRAGRLPELSAYVKTDPAALTSLMYAIGLSSASLDTLTPGNSPAAAVQGAYFRYNTLDDGTAFWRTVTSDGTTRKVNTTTTAIAVATSYRLRIAFVGVRGTSVSAVNFYINDVLVATHIVNLPLIGTALGYGARVETLTTAARNLQVARLSLSGP